MARGWSQGGRGGLESCPPSNSNTLHPTQRIPVQPPRDLLLKTFRTREEDTKTLVEECNKILAEALVYNKELTVKMVTRVKDEGASDNQEENTEDVVCDGIKLSDPEMDLLSLGHGFRRYDWETGGQRV